MFRMGLVHARDNGPGVSGAKSEHTARYQDLLYTRTRIGCVATPTRIGPEAYDIPDRRSGGVEVPINPTEIPGGLQVEPKF